MKEQTTTSIAFSPEFYKSNISDHAIRQDILSYLGEYRFQLPTYPYQIPLSQEQMKNSCLHAIDIKTQNGLNPTREKAELKGVISLESQLIHAETGDTVLWLSPPGPKNEGYGNYGFIFFGTVLPNESIRMTAYRVEHGEKLPQLEEYKMFLSRLGFDTQSFHNPKDFLKSPIVLKGINPDLMRNRVVSELEEVFLFHQDPRLFQNYLYATHKLQPFIDEFIRMVHDNATPDELRKAMNSIENMAIKLKEGVIVLETQYFQKPDKIMRLNYQIVMQQYDQKPPMVGGSCGGSSQSNNPFSSLNILSRGSLSELLSGSKSLSERYDDYHCPKCGQEIKGELKESDRSTWTKCCPQCGHEFNCAKHS
jgi:predicted RNA-binding Zn-ribbon protein involved in translation (DUF1610 family)